MAQYMRNNISNIAISPIWIVIYTTIILTSLTLTNKIIEWHGISFSACLITFPLIYVFCDIIAETYGYQESQKLIWVAIISCFIFSLIMQFAITIPSAAYYDNAAAYHQVFAQDLRFTIVACVAIVVGSLVNAYAISKWKILLQGRYFWIRSLGATALGELVNSLIAFPLAFFGTLPIHDIINLMFFSYVIKMLYALFAVYPASLVIAYHKSKGINAYSKSFDFNPFIKTESVQ